MSYTTLEQEVQLLRQQAIDANLASWITVFVTSELKSAQSYVDRSRLLPREPEARKRLYDEACDILRFTKRLLQAVLKAEDLWSPEKKL